MAERRVNNRARKPFQSSASFSVENFARVVVEHDARHPRLDVRPAPRRVVLRNLARADHPSRTVFVLGGLWRPGDEATEGISHVIVA